LENLKERDYLDDLDIDGRILEWVLEKYGGRLCTGTVWLRIGTSGVSLEHGNGPSGSIKGWEFLEQLNDYKLLKKDFALWNSFE
jgi:hypothetical protein